MKKPPFWPAACAFAAVCAAGCGTMPAAKQSAELMGTVVEVTVHHRRLEEAEAAMREAFAEAERLEGMFSARLGDSEVSAINMAAGIEPVRVSEEVFSVIALAAEYSELSGGAFDITVLPLLELWGGSRGMGRVPEESEIAEALRLVGYEKMTLEPRERAVMLEKKGMGIDLGGIAKGFIVDRMAEILRQSGVAGALVNAGGDIYALGTSYGGDGWRVGLRHPRERGKIVDVISLRDEAVATSGDYERYFIHDGRRYSHIIDPRMGRPAEGVISATVKAAACVDADAMATMLFVLGAENGGELIRASGAEAVVFEEGWEYGLEKRI